MATAAMGQTHPVLVELFTSEGCSSCPPADQLLARLRQAQNIDGTPVITLSEHVDYWNQLGWADPFSSGLFTTRQQNYARSLRSEVYTPQMVVDGGVAFVGSDSRKAFDAIRGAAAAPKAAIELGCGTNPMSLRVRIDNKAGGEADVMLAIAEDALQSSVLRGENRGRLLPHSSVARRIAIIGRVKKQQSFTAEPGIALESGWKTENVSAVVFLEDRSNLHIRGAAEIAMSSCAAH
jgi:hypothetical protein